MNPKISVVMAVYNGEKYLKQAIESILNQTFKDFEFLIINDGSTDGTKNILDKYSYDKRIKVLDNKQNKGLIYSLNRGIEEAKGKYIARMDADDISYTNRFEYQYNFMEKNEEIILSGSSIDIILTGIPFIKKKYCVSTEYEVIKVKTLFGSQFMHPTVMIRRKYLIDSNLRYEEKYKMAEDYGLWSNIVLKDEVRNLNESFLKYRVLKNSVTRKANKKNDEREKILIKIYKNYFNNLNVAIDDDELKMHYEICMAQNLTSFKYSKKRKIDYLNSLPNRIKDFDSKILKEAIDEVIIKINIYQEGDIYGCNKKTISFKKAIFIESLKRKIKKIYV